MTLPRGAIILLSLSAVTSAAAWELKQTVDERTSTKRYTLTLPSDNQTDNPAVFVYQCVLEGGERKTIAGLRFQSPPGLTAPPISNNIDYQEGNGAIQDFTWETLDERTAGITDGSELMSDLTRVRTLHLRLGYPHEMKMLAFSLRGLEAQRAALPQECRWTLPRKK